MSGISPEISIILPAYQEEQRLPRAFNEIFRALTSQNITFEILVIDDGSPDRTAEVAEQWANKDSRVQVIRLGNNRGKGAAIKAGTQLARGDLFLISDVDMATPFREWENLRIALDREVDVAIGTRRDQRNPKRVYGFVRREIASIIFNGVSRISALPGIYDSQCGFKLWRAESAKEVFRRTRLSRFAFEVETLLHARQLKYRIEQVPVTWSHDNRSTVRVFRDGVRMGWDLIRILLLRIFRR